MRPRKGGRTPLCLLTPGSLVSTGEVVRLRPLLRQTQLEFLPLAIAFDADRDGWSNDAFHSRMNGMGAAVLVAETAGGALCGAYNPKGWLGMGDWRDAISAFLFTWPTNDQEQPAQKLPKIGGSGMVRLRPVRDD